MNTSSPSAAAVMTLIIKSKGLFYALWSALLFILTFPAFDFTFLAWIALVPLLITLRGKSLGAAWSLSWLTGTCFWMGLCSWMKVVPGFTWIDYAVCGLYLGAYFGLVGVTVNFVARHTRFPCLLTIPCLWVAVEYLRAHAGFLGVPWALLGHSQYLHLPLIQLASFTGVYGISFLIVMVNVIVSEFILARAGVTPGPQQLTLFPSAAVTGALLALSLVYGFRVMAQPSNGETVKVTVVQGNISQDMKWKPELRRHNLDTHISLTREAAHDSPAALIVWPETAVQGFLLQDLFLLHTFSTLVLDINIPLLVGGSQRPKSGAREWRETKRLNSAFLISPRGGVVQSYNKMHLLPFGEYVPYQDVFPWSARIMSIPDITSFLPGEDYTIFTLNRHKFGVLICWESLFPELARQFVNRGAEFFVNITNEAWFGDTAAPYQFFAMNVFRAVENRTAVVRSANTGVSGFIDPYGRLIGKVEEGGDDIFVAGSLTKEIPLARDKTFYTRYGDIWAYLNLAATFWLTTVAFVRRQRHRRRVSFDEAV